MTSTLLDQGDGYLKMKNLRKKEQENTLIMKENMDDDNNDNTAYKEGFVESMNSSDNNNSLSKMNQEESDTFNRLKSEFDSAMSTYAAIQKSIHDESLDYVNQDKNKLQKNYFARETPEIDDDDIKYEGCYRDYWRGGRSLPYWKGYMSKEQCAQAAADQGSNVFSLQYGNTWAPWWTREEGDPTGGRVPGKGYCFVGTTTTRAKKRGLGMYRRWRWALSWQWGYQSRWRYNGHGGWRNDWLNYRNWNVKRYGVYLGISTDGRIALRRHNPRTGGWVWYSRNRATKGKIQWDQERNVDYPGNDIRMYRNVSVQDCNKYCADDNRCAGHNHWGSKRYCWIKRGKSWRNPWNSKYQMDFYTKKRETTKSFLIVQDDGNVVLYKGTGPADNRGVLFSFNTNRGVYQKYLIKNQKWIDRRKYGRNYITQDEHLGRGQFIASDNGLHCLYLWWDGNILIGSNYTRCRKSEGVEVGGAWANSVYTIPKSDTRNLGKAFYKNEEGNKYAYKQKDIRFGSTYKLGRKNWNTWYNDLGWQWVKTVEQAKAVCNTDPRCAGFVYERVSEYPWITHGWNRVYKKGKGMWPYGRGKEWSGQHAYCDTYLRDVKLNNNYSCNSDVDEYITSKKYSEIAGQGKGRTVFNVRERTDSGGSDIKYMHGATYKQCEDYCEADDNCKGFNRHRNMRDGCWVKYDVSRARGNNRHWDLYTKSEEVPSGMDGTMRKNTACSIKKSTGQERHILEKRKRDVSIKIKQIIKEMRGLIEKAKNYNNTTNDGREERIKMVYQYEQIFKRLDQEEKDLEVLNKQEENEELQLTSQNYRYISWSIIAILIMIATMKFMKSK